MIDIFFISIYHRGSLYGTGNYLKAIRQNLGNNFRFHHVQLEHEEFNEYTTLKKEKKEYIYIPKPLNTLPKKSLDYEKKYLKSVSRLLNQEILKYKNVILHINEVLLIDSLKENLNCKIVFTAHSIWWKFYLNGNKKKFFIAWKNNNFDPRIKNSTIGIGKREQNLLLQSDKIICVTKNAKFFFKKTYGIDEKKIKVIYNGIENPKNKKYPILETKIKMGFSPNDKIILFVGRLDYGKGLEFLIDSFSEIYKETPNIKLVVIGDGNFEKYISLCNKIASRVVFTGRICKTDLYKYYQIAAIGVIPSLYEQCSYVAIEMMYHSLPMIVAAVDGLDEIFQHNFTALKVKVNEDKYGELFIDKLQLNNHLHSLLLDEKKGKQLGINARIFALKHFTLERMLSQTIDVYKGLF